MALCAALSSVEVVQSFRHSVRAHEGTYPEFICAIFSLNHNILRIANNSDAFNIRMRSQLYNVHDSTSPLPPVDNRKNVPLVLWIRCHAFIAYIASVFVWEPTRTQVSQKFV